MLILAGVSLNAIIGDNGVLTQAQNAKVTSNKINIMEEIETEFMRYNTDSVIDGEPVSAGLIIKKLIQKGIVDSVMESNGNFSTDIAKLAVIPLTKEDGSWQGEFEYVIKKDDFVLNVYQDIDGEYTVGESDIVAGEGASGGDVTGGKTLVTLDTFTSEDTEETDDNNRGKYKITGNASVMFVDKLEGTYSLYVKSGVNATVSIFKDMTLSNNGLQRSAIDIEPGGTLNLWIANGATVTVDSGAGISADGAVPGAGGYAGIHVPKYNKSVKIYTYKTEEKDGKIVYSLDKNGDPIIATQTDSIVGKAVLNLSGSGTLIAKGGNASNGASIPYGKDILGAGGGGAGAGIGGNGGIGAKGKIGVGNDGGTGEDCGIVNILDSLEVYAYGGAGGSGGSGSLTSHTDGQGGGASGYPAAGIGGGGAGGSGASCCSGGGGYCGGTPEYIVYNSQNGLPGFDNTIRHIAGGGYFIGADAYDSINDIYRERVAYGGIGSVGASTYNGHTSGNGGVAGSGGEINAIENSYIYAFNGNLFTDGTGYNEGKNQCPIYLQVGYYPAKYKYNDNSSSGNVILDLVENAKNNLPKSGYQNSIYLTGNKSKTKNYKNDRYLNINTKLSIEYACSVFTNVDLSYQGVGSGAGYIEKSNGTFTNDYTIETLKDYIKTLN